MGSIRSLIRTDGRDKGRLAAAAGAFVCASVAGLLARIAGDSLFLAVYGREALAFLYLGTAAVVGLLSFLFGTLAGRMPGRRLLVVSLTFLACLILIVRAALLADFDEVRVAGYLVADLTVSGSVILFWSYFAQLFDARKARRYIGFIGAAGTVGCMAAASGAGAFNRWFGVANLLMVAAFLLALFAVIVAACWKGPEQDPGSPVGVERRRGVSSASRLAILKNQTVRDLALLVGAGTVTMTLIDFQFKAGAQATYSADALPGFFGNFYAVSNIVVLVVQLFLMTWILRRGGLMVSLSLLPVSLLATSLVSLGASAFIWIVTARFAVQVMAFTIDSAALHILYLGVRRRSYGQARAFVDGMVKPLAMGLTGLFLFLGAGQVDPAQLAIGAALASGVWLIAARRNYLTYLSALVGRLGAKLAYPPGRPLHIADRSLEKLIKERLRTAPAEDLPYLLTIADELGDIDLPEELTHGD
jgi:ATP:ADP antiporter, AAA family